MANTILRRNLSDVALMLAIGALGDGVTVMSHNVEIPSKWVCGGVRDSLHVAATPEVAERDSVPLLTTFALRNWLTRNSDLGPQYGYGAWRDPSSGHVYFDVVDFHDSQSEALEVGRARGELAVFDIATRQTAYVA